MSLSAYPNLRLKITPATSIKMRFLPALPGSNASAAEAGAEAAATSALASQAASSAASSSSAASAISAAMSAATVPQMALFQVTAFASDAKHWAQVAKANSDQQIAMKAAFFN